MTIKNIILDTTETKNGTKSAIHNFHMHLKSMQMIVASTYGDKTSTNNICRHLAVHRLRFLSAAFFWVNNKLVAMDGQVSKPE